MKKGFTLIELLAWMSVAAVLVVVVTSNIGGAFLQYRNAIYSTNMNIVFAEIDQSILQDIKMGNGVYTLGENQITIGDVQYKVENENLIRTHENFSHTLCGGNVKLTFKQVNGQDYLVVDFQKNNMTFHREYRLNFLITRR